MTTKTTTIAPLGRSYASDRQQQPLDEVQRAPHYNDHPSGVETIQVVEDYSFNVGNALKYLFRLDGKDTRRKNLEKAAWYLEREYGRLLEGPEAKWAPMENRRRDHLTERVLLDEPRGSVLSDLLRLLAPSVGLNLGALVKALARVREEAKTEKRREEIAKAEPEVEYEFHRPSDGAKIVVWSKYGTYEGWHVTVECDGIEVTLDVTHVARYRDGGTTIVECGEILSIYSPSPLKKERRDCFCVEGRAWGDSDKLPPAKDRVALTDCTARAVRAARDAARES